MSWLDHLPYPPPWKAVLFNLGDEMFDDEDGIWCVTTDRGDPRDEYDVNEGGHESIARLEAAAPELFAACEQLVKLWADFMSDDGCVNPLDYPIDKVVFAAQDAIAKARVK